MKESDRTYTYSEHSCLPFHLFWMLPHPEEAVVISMPSPCFPDIVFAPQNGSKSKGEGHHTWWVMEQRHTPECTKCCMFMISTVLTTTLQRSYSLSFWSCTLKRAPKDAPLMPANTAGAGALCQDWRHLPAKWTLRGNPEFEPVQPMDCLYSRSESRRTIFLIQWHMPSGTLRGIYLMTVWNKVSIIRTKILSLRNSWDTGWKPLKTNLRAGGFGRHVMIVFFPPSSCEL